MGPRFGEFCYYCLPLLPLALPAAFTQPWIHFSAHIPVFAGVEPDRVRVAGLHGGIRLPRRAPLRGQERCLYDVRTEFGEGRGGYPKCDKGLFTNIVS